MTVDAELFWSYLLNSFAAWQVYSRSDIDLGHDILRYSLYMY